MLRGRGWEQGGEELCGFPDLNREGLVAGVGDNTVSLRSCAGVGKAVGGRGGETRSLSP